MPSAGISSIEAGTRIRHDEDDDIGPEAPQRLGIGEAAYPLDGQAPFDGQSASDCATGSPASVFTRADAIAFVRNGCASGLDPGCVVASGRRC